MRTDILKKFKKEPVLAVSAVCMLLSMLFVPPSAAYISYIDFRVLALLFCLMAVVAGLQRHGLFTWMAQRMLTGKKQLRTLFLLLILLPFFSSMLVTNDVALITFVPFAILILSLTGQQEYMIFVIIMQTVAANLGSMATPVGNPQNLYLYSRFGLSAGAFFGVVLPCTLLTLPLLGVSVMLCPKKEVSVSLPETDTPLSSGQHAPRTALMLNNGCQAPPAILMLNKKKIVLYLLLFVLCLLSVFHVLHYGILLFIVCLALFFADRSLYRSMDYGLLLTFVCFFVFAGNIGAIESVKMFLQNLMADHPLFTAALASQVISNVPAAVLLSNFTTQWKALLLGTDIGGLGTPIASLASLISFRLYMKTDRACAGKYLLWFSLVNFGGLVLLILFAVCLKLA